ncbi:primase-helicase family protein [Phaeobacter sp. SYSU ZJ3003]|uniref:primase-helicase family protein n=1 Tax=Phaeobacter sp. SYSU ZJ3003 TaxID=2109330 RepID=UPI00351CB2F4
MPEFDPNHRIILSRAIASWFVRRDGKYYDIDNYTTKLALPDVQAICIERFADEFAHIPLSKDLIRAAFKASFNTLTTPAAERVGTWSGSVLSAPGCSDRLLRHRGTVSINTWTKPTYRSHGINAAEYGCADEFFSWIFPRHHERTRALDWLAWNLQHESDKPGWCLFLYSDKKGTGKSKFATLCEALFGKRNTAREYSASKLTGRFNVPVLTSKLVIGEEIKLQTGSGTSNALKTYITEDRVLGEMKGVDAQMIEQRCCFVFTSNHPPLWIEPDERRYYVLNIDHDGHASGPRSNEFVQLMIQIDELLADETALARLYNALMSRELSPDFNAKSLNITQHSTDIMRQVQNAAQQVSTELLREHLDQAGCNCIAESELVSFVQQTLRGNIETIRHKMTELGWHRHTLKWGGVDHNRVLWIRDGYSAYRGRLKAPDGTTSPIASPLAEEARL